MYLFFSAFWQIYKTIRVSRNTCNVMNDKYMVLHRRQVPRDKESNNTHAHTHTHRERERERIPIKYQYAINTWIVLKNTCQIMLHQWHPSWRLISLGSCISVWAYNIQKWYTTVWKKHSNHVLRFHATEWKVVLDIIVFHVHVC